MRSSGEAASPARRRARRPNHGLKHFRRFGHRLGQRGLSNARHVFHQDVVAAEQSNDEILNDLIFAEDDPGQLRLKARKLFVGFAFHACLPLPCN